MVLYYSSRVCSAIMIMSDMFGFYETGWRLGYDEGYVIDEGAEEF
jgi:hypothetical protein